MRSVISYVLIFFASFAFAAAEAPQTFTLDGRLYSDSAGTIPLTDTDVDLVFQILDDSQTCVLYQEFRNNFDASVTNGFFNFQIGSALGDAKRSGGEPGLTMKQIYSNVPQAGLNGQLLSNGNPCPHAPSAGDQRHLRVQVTPSSDSVTRVLTPFMAINSVPSAIVAEHAESAATVGAFGPADLLRVDTSAGYVLSQSNLASIFTTSNFSALTTLLAGTSTLYNRPASNGTTVIPTIASPSTPSAGQIWFNGGNLLYHDGGATRTISTGSSTSVAAGAGTAAAPSISFSGDPDTGWYSAGADTLAAATGGAERVRISASGNFGIGSTAPDARLTLGGAQSAPAWTSSGIGIRQNSVTYTDTSSSGTVGFNYVNAFGIPNLAASSATTYTNASAFSLYPPTPGTNVTLTNSTGLTVNASTLAGVTNGYGMQVNAPTGATNNYAATFLGGNVGIGTTSPTAALQLKAGTASSGTAPLKLTAGTNLTTPEAGAVEFDGTSLYYTDATNTRRTLATSSGGSFTNINSISNSSGNITLSPMATTGAVVIDSGTPSSSSTTGALQITGGVGITNNLYTDGSVNAGTSLSISGLNGIRYPTQDTTVGASIAIGPSSLSSLSGSNAYGNTGVGYQSLTALSTGQRFTAVGYRALASATTGTNGTAFGHQAAENFTVANTLDYSSPTAIGSRSLRQLTTGRGNTAVGRAGFESITTGDNNTALGDGAGQFSVAASSNNTAIGASALNQPGTRSNNTGVGEAALYYVSSGSGNTALGRQAGHSITTGANNITIGSYPTIAVGITTGSNNILMGTDVRPPSQTADNQLNIGNLIYATGLGSGATASTGNVGIGTTAPNAKLEVIGQIRAVGGTGSLVVGNGATATGFNSIALGDAATASGSGTVALGRVANATGNRSIVLGTNSRTFSDHGLALGRGLEVGNATPGTGDYSVGLSAGNPASVRRITGTGSIGIYLGDTDLTTISTNNVLAIMGGNAGIGVAAPTATLQLKAGTAAAGTAPLKLTAGTNLTTPEAGAIEFDGTSLFYTDSTNTRRTLGVAGGGITALTGDVTASGTGSVTATIANDAVTFAKTQNIATQRLLGRGTAGSGDIEELTLGAGLTLTGTTLNVADTTDDDSFSTLLGVCGNGFLPYKAGGVWTCIEATSTLVNDTLVMRGVSGSFEGNQVTANSLRLNNSGSFVSINNPIAANYALTLPTTDGDANQVLQTDGSGVLSWVTSLVSGSTGLFANGTAVAPSISFTNDTNTGFFSPSNDANVIAAATNGVERMRVDSTGNVGIGLTNPGSILGVAQSQTGRTNISISNLHTGAAGSRSSSVSFNGYDNAGTALINRYEIGTDYELNSTNSFYIFDNIASQPRIYISPTGNVGVGTTAPTAALMLKAGTAAAGTAPLKLTAGTNLTTPEAGAIEFDGTNLYYTNSSNARQTLATSAGGSFTNVTSIANSGGNITLSPVATTGGVVIDSGTTSTSSTTGALRVQGGIGVTGDIYAGTTINAGTTLTAGTNAFIPQIYGSASAGGDIRIDGTSDATKGDVLLATAGGNVGVGTTAPISGAKLDARGRITTATVDYATGTTGSQFFMDLGNNTGNTYGILQGYTAGASNYGDIAINALGGNVGIGTTAPARKFSVASIATDAVDIAVNATSTNVTSLVGLPLVLRNTSTTAGNYSAIGFQDSNSNYQGSIGMMYGAHSAATQGTFYIEPRLVGTPTAFVVVPSGNVGVGTTAPLDPLSVVTTQPNRGFSVTGDSTVGETVAVRLAANLGSGSYNGITQPGDMGLFFEGTAQDNSKGFVITPWASTTSGLRIDGNGNIGIGTSAPQRPLHVVDHTITNQPTARFDYSNGSGGIEILGAAPSSAYVNFGESVGVTNRGRIEYQNSTSVLGADSMSFTTNSTEKMRITSGGYVGIGTTNPNGSLHLVLGGVGEQTATADSAVFPHSGMSISAGGLIVDGNYTDGSYRTRLLKVDRGGNVPLYIQGSSGVANSYQNIARFGAHQYDNSVFGVFGAATVSGNLGIGTTAPAARLQVNSGHVASGLFSAGSVATNYGTGGVGFNLLRDESSALWTSQSDGANNGAAAIYANILGDLYFLATASTGNSVNSLTDAQAFASTRMTIRANGNVGIGSTAPSAALQIKAGTAAAGTAPLKLTAGTNLTTPEAGAIEFDGTNLYYTDATNARRTIATGSGSGDFKADGTVPMTAPIQVTDGTKDSPSITFSNDLNTGIYRVSNDRFGFSVGGNIVSAIEAGAGLYVTGSSTIKWSSTGTGLSSPDVYLNRHSANVLKVSSNGTTGAADLYVTGNIGIGTSAPQAKLHVVGNLRVDTLNAATATQVCIDGNNVLSSCSSSIRYKENVEDLHPALQNILKLRPVSYDWLASKEHDVGFIAEEVEQVDSRLVTYNKKKQIQGVKYDQLAAPIIKALQELYYKIVGVERDVASLKTETEAKLKKLEAENAKLKQQNDMIKSYLCSKDPKAEICQ